MRRPAARPEPAPGSPEAELLAACTRVRLDAVSAERIQWLIRQGVDWDRLVRTAANQAVRPLLYRHLQALPPVEVPAPILAELRRHALATTAQNLLLARELNRVVGLFQAENIRVIPYKGPMLAAWVYQDLSLRPMSDVDLLVHPRDYRASRALLLSHGYRRVPELDLGWESAFRNPDGTAEIDLHQALLPFWFGVRVDFDPLWERCTPVNLFDATQPNLAPEHLLTLLCLQLFKDAAEGRSLVLRQVCDVAEVLRVHAPLDGTRLLETARSWRVERELYLGLRLAHEVLGAVIPDLLQSRVTADRSLDRFVAALKTEVLAMTRAKSRAVLPCFRAHGFLVRWHPELTEKLRAMLFGLRRLVLALVVPTDQERALISLPPALAFLYALLRPLRLTLKYLLIVPLQKLRNCHRRSSA